MNQQMNQEAVQRQSDKDEKVIGLRMELKCAVGLAWFLPMSSDPGPCDDCNLTPCRCVASCGSCASRPCVCVTNETQPRNLGEVVSLPAAFELNRKDFLYNAEQRQRKLQIMSSFRQVRDCLFLSLSVVQCTAYYYVLSSHNGS